MSTLKRLTPLFRNFLKTPKTSKSLTSKAAPEAKIQPNEINVDKSILVDRLGAITTISINRPEKKNCLDVATSLRLSEVINDFEEDADAKVGIIHGVGSSFCSGYDLNEIANYDGESEESVPQFGPLSNRSTLCKKPLIAAINGYAVGAGLEIALMCDLRIADSTALLGFLNRRFGIPSMSGGTTRIASIIGYSRAMEMILTGRCVNAETAFNWGLVNQMVACGTALGTAVMLGNSLLKFPGRAMLADRASLHYATFAAKQIDDALQFEKDNSAYLLLEDGVEGAKKFVSGIGRHGKFIHLVPQDVTFKKLSDDLL